ERGEERGPDDEVHHHEQHRARREEHRAVGERQPPADAELAGQVLHAPRAGLHGSVLGRRRSVPDGRAARGRRGALTARGPVRVPADHGMRRRRLPIRPFRHNLYPTPGTVSITCGSPSFFRSVIIVTRTTLVNGSMFSSHALASRSSWLTP